MFAATEILEAQKVAAFGQHEMLSFEDYPRTLGAATGAAAGGVAGLGHGLATGASGLGHLARLGLGTLLGGAVGHLAGGLTSDVSPETEHDNLLYDREGPLRSMLAAARPFVPTFHPEFTPEPGHLAVPPSHQDVDLKSFHENVSQPIDPGPLAALGGRVSPQQVTVSAMSPGVSGDHFLRPQYINNQPVLVPSLDPLIKADGETLTGSESLGSNVGYDYNTAMEDLFAHRLPVQPGEHALLLGSHAHGDPLRFVSGVQASDVLKSLHERGLLTPDTAALGLETCNAAGCDIPSMVHKSVGFVPPKMLYTPPGAVATDYTTSKMLEHLHQAPEHANRAWLHPTTVTLADMADQTEPSASRWHTEPRVPHALTGWVDQHATPIEAVTRGAARLVPPLGPVADAIMPRALDALHHARQPVEVGLDPEAGDVGVATLRQKFPQLFPGR